MWLVPCSLAMESVVPWCFEEECCISLAPLFGGPEPCFAAVTILVLKRHRRSWRAYLLCFLGKFPVGCQREITKLILPITSLAGDYPGAVPFPLWIQQSLAPVPTAPFSWQSPAPEAWGLLRTRMWFRVRSVSELGRWFQHIMLCG